VASQQTIVYQMKIVVDTSVFMSALISPKGKCAELLLNPIFQMEKYTCYFLIVEVFKHKDKILKCSKLTESELLEQVYILMKNLTLINENQISPETWQNSFQLTEDVDTNDTAFVALTEMLDGKLWTLDNKLLNGLKQKGYNNIVTTKDIETLSIQSNTSLELG